MVASYLWSFGDGGSATGATAMHTYQTAGTYTAQLKVTDNQGAVDTASLSIVVNPAPAPPVAPSSLSVTLASNRNVRLAWRDNSSNESGFYVERAAKTKTLQFARIATVAAGVTNYSLTEVAGTWVYRVQAFNSLGVSPYSNTATLRVR
jgi:PKD repeat protein